MPEQTNELISTIFLDTNVLIYLWSYLGKARELSLPPFPSKLTDYAEVNLELKNKLPDSIVGFYLKGCKTLAYLQNIATRVDGEIGVQIRTSRLGKLEMLNGALDGKAHILMAQQGIPYRMRQRISNISDLVTYNLRRNDIDEVFTTANETIDLLQKNDNIIIEFVEAGDATNDIAQLAEFLSRYMYLDVLDVWMYACALSIQADQVLCFDDAFKKLINRIKTGDGDWAQIRADIKTFLQTLYNWSKPILPKTQNQIPDAIPRQWA